jgi:hypothetical protein
MAGKDYIPHGDSDFLDWAKNLVAYASTHYQGWSVPDPSGTLAGPLQNFTAAHEKFLDPNHGKVDTERKNETKEKLIHAVREYCQAWVFLPKPGQVLGERLCYWELSLFQNLSGFW